MTELQSMQRRRLLLTSTLLDFETEEYSLVMADDTRETEKKEAVTAPPIAFPGVKKSKVVLGKDGKP